MKTVQRLMISLLAILLLTCAYLPVSHAKAMTPERVPYRTGTKAVISKKECMVGEKATIKVRMKADDKEHKSRTLVKFSVKSLTPEIASVKKNSKGTAAVVAAKKKGSAKIKVYAEYTCLEKCYVKCINKKPQVTWVKRTFKETTTLTLKVKKKPAPVIPSEPIIVDPGPICGGSVRLYFEVDGASYGKPISVAVGIAPFVDYADQFPPAPEKNGYVFDGWYTKDQVKIGTTAGEIYPAYPVLQSGKEATVYAGWVKTNEEHE